MEATGTAGNLSGLSPKGTARPAVIVATGETLPVAFAGAEFLLACAGGTAETAVTESADAGPCFFSRGEAHWAGASFGPRSST